MLHCGLLGERLGHSFSPRLHALLADYAYELYECKAEDLSSFLQESDVHGLNVTIPYKTAVLPYCNELSETAQAIGSVNTLLRRADGTLFGDNTDAAGFSAMLDETGLDLRGKKALVLGSGGASLTVCHVLRRRGVGEVVVISRRGDNNYDTLDQHADAEILVNTTPVGMYPNNGDRPVDLTAFPQCKLVLDLIYNPARTALMLQAESLFIPVYGGLRMLVYQAKAAAELFSGKAISEECAEAALQTIARETQNLILIGMPGCGKSTLGALAAERLGRDFVDADAYLEETLGRSIPEIFASEGEAAFRQYETKVLSDLGKRTGLVIATGGGCVTRTENYPLLHQNAFLVYIKRPLEELAREGRPLSQSTDLAELYAQRAGGYAFFPDRIVGNDLDLAFALDQLLRAWERDFYLGSRYLWQWGISVPILQEREAEEEPS